MTAQLKYDRKFRIILLNKTILIDIPLSSFIRIFFFSFLFFCCYFYQVEPVLGLAHVTPGALHSLLDYFASFGSAIAKVRSYAQK